MPVTEIFEFNLPLIESIVISKCLHEVLRIRNHQGSYNNIIIILSLFSMKLSELVGYFTTCEKLRAFERNQNLENSCLMSWRPIV